MRRGDAMDEHCFRRKCAVHDILAMAKRERIGHSTQNHNLVIDGERASAVFTALLFDESIEGFTGKTSKNQRWSMRRPRIELFERQNIGMVPEFEEHVGFTFY